jgi:hypothetical protein
VISVKRPWDITDTVMVGEVGRNKILHMHQLKYKRYSVMKKIAQIFEIGN